MLKLSTVVPVAKITDTNKVSNFRQKNTLRPLEQNKKKLAVYNQFSIMFHRT